MQTRSHTIRRSPPRLISANSDDERTVIAIASAKAAAVISRAVDIVANATGVTREEIMARTRKVYIVRCRWMAIWMARNAAPISTTTLGRFFGLDHSTVLHALKKVSSRIETDQAYKDIACKLLERLTGGKSTS